MRARVYMCAHQCPHTRLLPETVPEFIIYRGHPHRARERAHTHTHTQSESHTQTSCMQPSGLGEATSLHTNLGTWKQGKKAWGGTGKPPQVGPALTPLSWTGFAAALKTSHGREGAASTRVWRGRARLTLLPLRSTPERPVGHGHVLGGGHQLPLQSKRAPPRWPHQPRCREEVPRRPPGVSRALQPQPGRCRRVRARRAGFPPSPLPSVLRGVSSSLSVTCSSFQELSQIPDTLLRGERGGSPWRVG